MLKRRRVLELVFTILSLLSRRATFEHEHFELRRSHHVLELVVAE